MLTSEPNQVTTAQAIGASVAEAIAECMEKETSNIVDIHLKHTMAKAAAKVIDESLFEVPC